MSDWVISNHAPPVRISAPCIYHGVRKCSECRLAKNRERSARRYNEKRVSVALRIKANYLGHKLAVFGHYGSECACCGEKEALFLTIDHVDNDGHLHRREPGRSSHNNIYGWLVRSGFPEGFQTLCSNCNHGKHRNNGVCPHVARRLNDHPVRE